MSEVKVGDALAGLLKGFGVESTATRATVEDAAVRAYAERGLAVEVYSLRYGHLVLSASPQVSYLARMCVDQVLADVQEASGTAVASIVVRPLRASERHALNARNCRPNPDDPQAWAAGLV